MKKNEQQLPILEFYNDEPIFFPDFTEKKFYKKIKQLGITSCIIVFPHFFHATKLKLKKIATTAPEFDCGKVFLYKDVLIAVSGIGSPFAAALTEEIATFGIENIVVFGTAGKLDQKTKLSDIVVVNEAIRDEGTSYKYLSAKPTIKLNKDLVKILNEELKEENFNTKIGKVWTTDALYNETKAQVAKRIGEGALAVEMECAAYASVCKVKGINFAQFLYFSDNLDIVDGKRIVEHNASKQTNIKFLKAAYKTVKRLETYGF